MTIEKEQQQPEAARKADLYARGFNGVDMRIAQNLHVITLTGRREVSLAAFFAQQKDNLNQVSRRFFPCKFFIEQVPQHYYMHPQ